MKNFGLIKEGYIKLMQEGLEENNKNKQKAFKNFINNIKNSSILKKQKNVYNLLESVNTIDSEFVEMYLNEAINILDNIDESLIVNENIKLLKPLLEFNINLSELEYSEKQIHESITDFIYLPRNPKSFNRVIESKYSIVNYKPINENVIIDESKIYPPSLINELMLNTIATKYSSLSLLETKMIASIINKDVVTQKQLFDELLHECNEVIDNMLENKELVDIHEDLSSSKNKLTNMDFITENFLDDMFDLMELKELTTI